MIWNPWRKNRLLEAEIRRLKNEVVTFDNALRQSADRYDKIRETNMQLREALTLYRNA
jgi:septal ring factor EnvC (AmiA/AmiB activator)